MTFKVSVFACVMVAGIPPAIGADPSPAVSPVPATTQPAAGVATDPASVAAPPSTDRDPTEPQAALRQAIENMHGAAAGRTRAPLLPQVIRRGLVIVAGKPPAALIEVPGSGLLLVHEGSVFSAGPSGGTILHVVKLGVEGMEIETDSPHGKTIVR